VNGTPTPWHPASDGIIVNINGTTVGKTVSAKTGITVGSAGSSLAHDNMQPSVGAYFIMYLP
jgi:microcystin-dependent protein